ncbi:hypothetical protein ACWEN3_42740, partial [Streptomyces sp. NPDC004561]
MEINRVAKHPPASGIVYVVAREHRRRRVRLAAQPRRCVRAAAEERSERMTILDETYTLAGGIEIPKLG